MEIMEIWIWFHHERSRWQFWERYDNGYEIGKEMEYSNPFVTWVKSVSQSHFSGSHILQIRNTRFFQLLLKKIIIRRHNASSESEIGCKEINTSKRREGSGKRIHTKCTHIWMPMNNKNVERFGIPAVYFMTVRGIIIHFQLSLSVKEQKF